jgi:hypothetical protein
MRLSSSLGRPARGALRPAVMILDDRMRGQPTTWIGDGRKVLVQGRQMSRARLP